MTRAEGLQQIDAWNRDYPVGTPVVVIRDNGSAVDTVTRSEACSAWNNDPVIWVAGISGFYLLSRVHPKSQIPGLSEKLLPTNQV
jgi:hypothetical protein